MGWQGSDRKGRLPADWRRIRLVVLRRDRWTCRRCGRPANQVDHIVPGDDHRPANLQALCKSCHAT